MADRTAVRIFSNVFYLLANKGTKECIKIAHDLWEECSNYDFTYDQLECDVLGLAEKTKKGIRYKDE